MHALLYSIFISSWISFISATFCLHISPLTPFRSKLRGKDAPIILPKFSWDMSLVVLCFSRPSLLQSNWSVQGVHSPRQSSFWNAFVMNIYQLASFLLWLHHTYTKKFQHIAYKGPFFNIRLAPFTVLRRLLQIPFISQALYLAFWSV